MTDELNTYTCQVCNGFVCHDKEEFREHLDTRVHAINAREAVRAKVRWHKSELKRLRLWLESTRYRQ